MRSAGICRWPYFEELAFAPLRNHDTAEDRKGAAVFKFETRLEKGLNNQSS